jgi:hypothetical protein
MEGVVKFFCKRATINDDPASWSSTADAQNDPGLPHTYNKPSWWDSAPAEGPAMHYASSAWDGCCKKADQYNNASAQEGFPTKPQ